MLTLYADDEGYDLFIHQLNMPYDNVSVELNNLNLKVMDNWCKEVGITHTPTFFVNGYRLSNVYNAIAELKYITSIPVETGPA